MTDYSQRGEYPEDAAGVTILPGAIVLTEGTTSPVYEAVGWAYATGYAARGRAMRWSKRRGWEATEDEGIFRIESALVWGKPLSELQTDGRARWRQYRALLEESGAAERIAANVRANKDQAARALGRHRE